MFDFRHESIDIYVSVHNVAEGLVDRKKYKADEIIIHPRYNPDKSFTTPDIALLKLRKELNFNGIVKPICLPTRTG